MGRLGADFTGAQERLQRLRGRLNILSDKQGTAVRARLLWWKMQP